MVILSRIFLLYRCRMLHLDFEYSDKHALDISGALIMFNITMTRVSG